MKDGPPNMLRIAETSSGRLFSRHSALQLKTVSGILHCKQRSTVSTPIAATSFGSDRTRVLSIAVISLSLGLIIFIDVLLHIPLYYGVRFVRFQGYKKSLHESSGCGDFFSASLINTLV